ncbi:heterokaryon incompatibility, partial [Apodospora peruviana]
YETLSYTWGDESERRDIMVNLKRQPITASLECALQQLRLRDKDRRLWIDSMCIDQDDDAERQHLVQLMRRIYQGATHVLVWLGPSEDQSDPA